LLATCWPIALLVWALQQRCPFRGGANTGRHGLRRLRLRWGRPRLALPRKTAPQKREPQWALVKAVVDAGPEAVGLYDAAARVHTLPWRRAMWPGIGQHLRGVPFWG
jgi:hypothetical protein